MTGVPLDVSLTNIARDMLAASDSWAGLPSQPPCDELIAERRAEARAEDREEEARQRRAGR